MGVPEAFNKEEWGRRLRPPRSNGAIFIYAAKVVILDAFRYKHITNLLFFRIDTKGDSHCDDGPWAPGFDCIGGRGLGMASPWPGKTVNDH